MNLWGSADIDGYESPVEVVDSRQREYPIPQDVNHWTETRIYLQDIRKYQPLAISTPGDGNSYLVAQGQIDRTGYLFKFFRVYSTIPATRREPTSFSFEFPAFVGDSASQRNSFTDTVAAEIEYRYYLPGVTSGISNIRDIPIVPKFRPVADSKPNTYLSYVTDGSPILLQSDPTQAAYELMITNGSEIAAEDSELSVYMGEIVERATVYILPK